MTSDPLPKKISGSGRFEKVARIALGGWSPPYGGVYGNSQWIIRQRK